MSDADDLYSDLYGDEVDGGDAWPAIDAGGDAGDDAAAPASPGAAALASPPPSAAPASAAPAAAPAPARSSFIPPGSASASTSSNAASFIPPAPRPAFLPPAPQPQQSSSAPAPPSAAPAGGEFRGVTHAAAAQQQQQPPSEERKVMPHEMPDEGKMFIGGLNWETTDEGLKQYFSQFGRVTHCTIMREAGTNRSRGFAFLAFAEPATVNVVMVKEHFLDGKMIDPKRAIPRGDSASLQTSRCFIGSVPQSATAELFRKTFEPFGTLTECNMLLDGATGRPRGFGFVSFTEEASAQKALSSQPLFINGEQIEVKRAQPRGDARATSARDGERRPPRRDGGSGSYGGADGRGGSPAQAMPMGGAGGAAAPAFDPHAMAALFQQTGWGANFNPLLMQQMMMGGMGMGMPGMPGMGAGMGGMGAGMGMPGFGMPAMGMGGMPMMPFGGQQQQQGWGNNNGGGAGGYGGQQGSPPYNGGQNGGRPQASRERSFGDGGGGGERSGSAEASGLPRAPIGLPRRPDVSVPPPLSQRERSGPPGGSGGEGGRGGGRPPAPSGNNWARVNDDGDRSQRGRSRSPGRGSTYTPVGGGGGGRDRERERSPRRHGGGGGGGGGPRRY